MRIEKRLLKAEDGMKMGRHAEETCYGFLAELANHCFGLEFIHDFGIAAEKNGRWLPEQMLDDHARGHFAAGCEAVITGHYHTPFSRATAEGKILISLGDWIDQYSYAVFEDGAFSLETFSAPEA